MLKWIAKLVVAFGLAGPTMADNAGRTIDPRLMSDIVDARVIECLADTTERVELMEDGETICWNSAIFPLQVLRFSGLANDAERLIFSSRGGNVVTAITLANMISNLDLPIIFAGECVSACASVIAPGVTNARIHSSAYFLIHGITSFDFQTFKSDFVHRKTQEAEQEGRDGFSPAALVPMAWNYYQVQWPRSVKFLEERGIAKDYMLEAETRMIDAKDDLDCPLELFDYFAVLSREHIVQHLGSRLSVIDEFAGAWEDPRLSVHMPYLRAISEDGVVAYIHEMNNKRCAKR